MSDKRRIVVLDDNDVFAEMVSSALSPEYEIWKGSDGIEGLELCAKCHPDLIIADIGMPRMDAGMMLKEMKKSPRLAAIPVMILTATHFNVTSRRQFEKDPQVRAIMLKPFVLDALTAAVKSVLEGPKTP